MFGTTQYAVKATLDTEGNVTARVVGSCTYGERTASVVSDITDEKTLAAIGSALKKGIADVRDDLNQQATSAAAESLVVATKKGEKV